MDSISLYQRGYALFHTEEIVKRTENLNQVAVYRDSAFRIGLRPPCNRLTEGFGEPSSLLCGFYYTYAVETGSGHPLKNFVENGRRLKDQYLALNIDYSDSFL